MRRPLRILIFLSCLILAPYPVAAGAANPIEGWGNFAPQTAFCQRVIGRSGALCAHRLLHLHNRCTGQQIPPPECGDQSLDNIVIAARANALESLQLHCADPQLSALGFDDVADVLGRITTACRQTVLAVASTFGGPAPTAPGPPSTTEPEELCRQATARTSEQLMRLTFRVRHRALDHIAVGIVNSEQSAEYLRRSRALVEKAHEMALRRLRSLCASVDFESLFGRSAGELLAQVAQQPECADRFLYLVENVHACPAPVCRNGIREPGELCDDGNDVPDDACSNQCTPNPCNTFASSYDLIQSIIFEDRGCTAELCHADDFPGGGLDLTAESSHENLIDVAARTVPGGTRVVPGRPFDSLLWVNVAAKTLPAELRAPVRSMPIGPDKLPLADIEVLRLWIEAGAPRTGSIPGTGDLLDACLPAR